MYKSSNTVYINRWDVILTTIVIIAGFAITIGAGFLYGGNVHYQITNKSDAGSDILYILGWATIVVGGGIGSIALGDRIYGETSCCKEFEMRPSRHIRIEEVNGYYTLYFERLGSWWKWNTNIMYDDPAMLKVAYKEFLAEHRSNGKNEKHIIYEGRV